MLFSVEQAFVGRDEKQAPLKTPAWEASSSYTPLFPSKKFGACLGEVYKIINPLRLQGSRTKKILSSNMSLCYTQGTGTFFEDYDVTDSNNLTLTLVLLSL